MEPRPLGWVFYVNESIIHTTKKTEKANRASELRDTQE